MLEQVEWGEFKLWELFEISTTKSFDEWKLNLFEFNNPELIEFVGRTRDNNWIKWYTERINWSYPNPENTISISQIWTIVAQLRKNKRYASQNIFILKANNKDLISLFCLSAINTSLSSKFSWWYSNYPTLSTLQELIIKLPIKNWEIDFEFMDKFIAELEAEHQAELETYFETTGLKNYELTSEELKVLKDFEEWKIEWKNFNVIDVFNVKNTWNILSRDIVENSWTIPYLCASSENNWVSSYITYDEKFLDKGNCIFIGWKTFVVSYQETDFYSNDSHNLVLYLKDDYQKTKLKQLYLACCINKSLWHRYTRWDSISNKKIQKDVVLLPIKNNQIDYERMEIFISAIQKLVIKDVVIYNQERLNATAEVINN